MELGKKKLPKKITEAVGSKHNAQISDRGPPRGL